MVARLSHYGERQLRLTRLFEPLFERWPILIDVFPGRIPEDPFGRPQDPRRADFFRDGNSRDPVGNLNLKYLFDFLWASLGIRISTWISIRFMRPIHSVILAYQQHIER